MSYLFDNYAPLDVAFVSGKACWLQDEHGKKYLDALSGVGVVNLGHCHANITEAITKQASTLLHTSNWYQLKHQESLAQKLCQLTGMSKAFFANSGAEANEAAIKLSRLYARKNKIDNPIILTCRDSFHGRTFATLSATGSEKVQTGFSPLLESFIHIDFNDIDAIVSHSNNPNIVGIMLEPILGERGVIIPDENYLNQVRRICDDNQWLMILDEVQTGFGRTGELFSYQHNNIIPDILTCAKGMGNGVPIGACLGGEKVADLFTVGSHGSTFGGNPLCACVALSVLDTFESEQILANVKQQSEYFLKNAQQILGAHTKVKDIRAKGLMLAISLDKTYPDIIDKALKLGILINANGEHIRLLPPLIINQEEIDFLLKTLDKLIGELL